MWRTGEDVCLCLSPLRWRLFLKLVCGASPPNRRASESRSRLSSPTGSSPLLVPTGREPKGGITIRLRVVEFLFDILIPETCILEPSRISETNFHCLTPELDVHMIAIQIYCSCHFIMQNDFCSLSAEKKGKLQNMIATSFYRSIACYYATVWTKIINSSNSQEQNYKTPVSVYNADLEKPYAT